eukprot:TRINITY_DN119_c0_g1_i2.p1 TRINITY_DN119_c0_g1~~TRINITY_DN119_c0_g1_i2.p1  ORF type:complete len:1348 (-),score=270.44 TRINITY_DN119_c0_g1_i2:1737-5780(-)
MQNSLIWFAFFFCIVFSRHAMASLTSVEFDLQSYISYNTFAFDAHSSAFFTIAYTPVGGSENFLRIDTATGAIEDLGSVAPVSSVMAYCRAIDDVNKKYAFLSSGDDDVDDIVIVSYANSISVTTLNSAALATYTSYTGIAFNSRDGLLYTFAFDGSMERLLAIHPSDGGVVDLGPLPCTVVLACSATIDSQGNLYAFFGGNDSFVSTIIVANFTQSPLQTSVIPMPSDLSMYFSIMFNSQDGLLYTYAYNTTSQEEVLITVDPVTHLVVVVGSIGLPADPIVTSGAIDVTHNVYAFGVYGDDADPGSPTSMVFAAYGSRCGKGSYGTVGSDLCTSCDAGSYSAATNRTTATTCRTCDIGSYSLAGATVCAICPAGAYCPTSGVPIPSQCAVGTYSIAMGATTSTTCQMCAPGYYCPNTTTSIPCPALTYSTASMATSIATCIPCPRLQPHIVGASSCSAGSISTVSPNTMRTRGQLFVTISGSGLGTGDITGVTLNGVTAAVLSQTANSVTVLAGTTASASLGHVVVSSQRFGITSLSNAFRYYAELSVVASAPHVREGAAPTVLAVTLTARPLQTVVVPVSVSCQGASVSNKSISILPNEWASGTTVSVSVSEDLIASGSATCTVRFGPSTSLDALFLNLTQTVALTRLDNDFAAVVVRLQDNGARFVPALSGYIMTEGQAETISVRLSHEVVAPVVVTITQSVPQLMALGMTSLTFDRTDWNVTRNVSLMVFDDGVAQPAQWNLLSFAATASNTAMLASSVTELAMLVLDNDGPLGVVQCTPPVRNFTVESGQGTHLLVFMLNTFEFDDTFATLTFTSSNANVATVWPATIMRNNSHLDDFATVTITPVNDYTDNNDVPFTIAVATSVSIDPTAVAQTTFALTNQNSNRAGLNVSRAHLTVNETGSTDSFFMAFATIPSAVVVLTPVFDRTLMEVSPASVIVQQHNYQSMFWFTVRGIRNNVTGDVNATLQISCVTSDAKYAALSGTVYVQIVDIFWPVVLRLTPEVHPITGIPGNISVVDMLPGATFEYRARSVVNQTAIFSSGPLWYPPDFGGLRPDKNIVSNHTFISPFSQNHTGYVDVVIRNYDGGYAVMVDAAFYTRDCPFVGYVGYGETCRPCPMGAECPGGNRIWALPGWWSPGEFSGLVYACNAPVERCAGGRFSSCAVGYTGTFCSACDASYYAAGDGCQQCESTFILTALLLLQYALLFVFVLALLFMSEHGLDITQFVLLGLRAIWITQPSLTAYLDPFVQAVGNMVSLFVGDLNASHPGCSGVDNYNSLYFVNLAGTFTYHYCQLVLCLISYAGDCVSYYVGVLRPLPLPIAQPIADITNTRWFCSRGCCCG